MSNYLYPELSTTIIGASITVHRSLGFGLNEQCYKNALMIELKKLNMQALLEVRYDVKYQDELVGYYLADIVVENKIILELKVTETINTKHVSQP
ncbi:MAG: GxxExxY protein [Spirochaetes bacterium]|nr:GxxExxY protein [Spirochaetota bacterium]